MSKKKSRSATAPVPDSLGFGTYNTKFRYLDQERTIILEDAKSSQHSSIPIYVTDTEVYAAEPDGKLIPPLDGQRKCDYLIYSKNIPQSCFIELKGANISTKNNYNPYDQIISTIHYLKNDKSLKDLVIPTTEKHAFIVSPGRQKIPKGVDTKERQLWKILIEQCCLYQNIRPKVSDIVHYVKATPSERYSDKDGQIICSPKAPIKFPFHCS